MTQNPDTSLPKTPKVKVYKAILNQTGTNPPTATVIQNTYTDIGWVRSGAGQYQLVTPNEFPIGKTWGQIQNNNENDNNTKNRTILKQQVASGVIIFTYNETGITTDGLLINAMIEVETHTE